MPSHCLLTPTSRNWFLSALAASSLLSGAMAQDPVVLTTATGTNGADTYVQFGLPTMNFGAATSLTVKYGGNDTAGTNRKIYLRFDTSSLLAAVASAELSLTVSVNNGGSTNTTPQNFTARIYGLNDGATEGGGFLGEDWGETAISWENAPSNIVSGTGAGNAVKTGTETTDGGQAVLLGSFEVTASDIAGSVVVALSGQALVDFLNADSNGIVTFIVTRTGWTSGGGTPNPSQGGSNLVFASREDQTDKAAPTLTLGLAAPDDFRILSIAYPTEAGGALLTWRATIGKTYRVETSIDLTRWGAEVIDGWPDGGATEDTVSFEDLDFAGIGPRRFYRVLEEP